MTRSITAVTAEELVHLIKTRFVRPDGLLARTYPVTERTLFDNFDDLAPFFVFFGEAEFLLQQIRIIRHTKQDLVSLCADHGVLVTRNIDEWFGGLYALYKATHDRETFRLLAESVGFVRATVLKDGCLAAALDVRTGRAAPYYEPWSAGLLEVFCEMREDFPEAFEQAQNVLRRWVADEYFRRYHLFPYRSFPTPARRVVQRRVLSHFLPRRRYSRPLPGDLRGPRYWWARVKFETTSGWYSQLMKSNSTAAFALLELYRATGEPFWSEQLRLWLEAAVAGFVEGGRVFGEFFPVRAETRHPGVTPAFILVDVMCDAAWGAQGFGDTLRRAREVLDYCWGTRLPHGLVPFQEGAAFAHLDSQIDFAVSLRRYAELTGEHVYRDRCIELTQTALAEHYTPGGYLTFSGKVERNVIDPKYNALALKGIANLLTIDRPLYPDLQPLFKDR